MVGPFIDDTDFKTLETSLTIANTDVKLCKNGAASVNKNSGGGTHRVNGMYSITLDATDSNTVGELHVSVSVSGALIVVTKFVVLEEAVYDALFDTSAPGYLQPTTAGRTLDVTATGAAGIDWANVENPTTGVNLSATNIDVDQVVASVSGAVGSVTSSLEKYSGPRGPGVYLNDAAGNTNTTSYVDGIVTNPVSTIAAAKTIADTLSLDRIYLVNNSSITLAATMSDYEFVGIGLHAGNTISLASQNVDFSTFHNVTITGVQGGSNRAQYEHCIFGVATIHAMAYRCGFADSVTGTTLSNQDDIILDACYSMVAGNATPVVICSGASLDVSFRHYSGGVEIKGLNATAQVSIETDGQVIFNADCNVNGSVTLRGMLTITDNTAGMNNLTYAATSAGMSNKDGNFTFDSITDSLEAIRDGASAPSAADVADAVWDELQSAHVTAGSFGEMATEIADILTDTADLQANQGNWLTATGFATSGALATAQADLDTITGSDGVTLATAQALYAPAKAGDAMTLTTAGVDLIWDEPLSGHTTAGTSGKALSDAGAGGDPWATLLPGAYGVGEAGNILGNNLDAAVTTRSSHSAADVWTVGTRELTGAANVTSDGSAITMSASGVVGTVNLVNTTTTNTDMRGTDSALLAASAPTNFADLAITVTTGLVSVGTNNDKTGYSISGTKTTLDALNDLSGAAVESECNDALVAFWTSPATLVDLIWDEEITVGHTTADSAGAKLNAAGAAGDPWATALPAAYGAGTAGNILGNNLDAVLSARTLASADYFDPAADTVANVTLVATTTTNTDMRGTDSALITLGATAPAGWIDASAIAASALDGKGDWNIIVPDAAGVAAGLHATTDGLITTVDTVVDAIQVVTDQFVFSVPNQVDANAVGGGGGGLTAQQVRDAMLLAHTPGAAAATSIDAKLDDLASQGVTYSGPLNVDSQTLTIIRGDDYFDAEGRRIEFSSDDWPDLTTATAVVITLKHDSDGCLIDESAGVFVAVGGGTQTVGFELTAAQTSALTLAPDSLDYWYGVRVTYANGHEQTLVTGRAIVQDNVSC